MTIGKRRKVPPPEPIAGNGLLDRRMLLGRRSEEHTSELQSQSNLVCRLLLEKQKAIKTRITVLATGNYTCHTAPINRRILQPIYLAAIANPTRQIQFTAT